MYQTTSVPLICYTHTSQRGFSAKHFDFLRFIDLFVRVLFSPSPFFFSLCYLTLFCPSNSCYFGRHVQMQQHSNTGLCKSLQLCLSVEWISSEVFSLCLDLRYVLDVCIVFIRCKTMSQEVVVPNASSVA